MYDKILRALIEGGLPEPCCPTCRTDNWHWQGGTPEGAVIVGCGTCGRLYVAMSAAQRYGYYARRSGIALNAGDDAMAGAFFHLMMSVWTDYDRLRDMPHALVCTEEGSPEWGSDDETPF